MIENTYTSPNNDRQALSTNDRASNADRRVIARGDGAGWQLSDIRKIILGLHGDPCACGAVHPGEDVELKYLKAAMPLLIATRGKWKTAIMRWAAAWVPTLHGNWGEERIGLLADECYDDPKRRLSTDQLSRLFGVTEEQMRAFGLRSIRHAKSTARKRKAADKTRRKNASQARRAAVPGHTPRAQSKARTKPWEALNMSESSFYAKGLHKVPEAVKQAENTVERVPEPEHLECFVPVITADVLECFVPVIKVTKGTDIDNDNRLFLDALPF